MMSDYFGKDVFKLGFGLMRLPRLADGTIDVEQTSRMVDMFIAAGGTYFDTAFVYEGSEEATRKALVDRYPRESYTLATKLNAWLMCTDEASAKQQFYTSLERTNAGYFDYYLLHALQDNNWIKYDQYHIWDFAKELKAKGLIKYYGFSFHAGPKLLDKLLTEHPDVDFIQLQINYADWDNPEVASRECWEVARRHGVSVTVMEPVKGGALADPVPAVKDIFKTADPDASCASWAIRFVASLDGIITVLSGMSNVEQMADNLSYMRDFKPLSDSEQEVIKQAQKALQEVETIPCTACRYCVKGCPMSIEIPAIFKAENEILKYNRVGAAKNMYTRATQNGGKATDCIACGQCEGACPQRLEIIDLLKKCVEDLETA